MPPWNPQRPCSSACQVALCSGVCGHAQPNRRIRLHAKPYRRHLRWGNSPSLHWVALNRDTFLYPCVYQQGSSQQHGMPSSKRSFLHHCPRAALLSMPRLRRALRKAGRPERLVFARRSRRRPEAELAAEVLVVGRHGQRQPHVPCEELLQHHHVPPVSSNAGCRPLQQRHEHKQPGRLCRRDAV